MKGSPIAKFAPFLDPHGLIRARGRIEHASDLSYDAKYPIILGPGAILSRVLFEIHLRLMHAGPEQVRYEFRKKFIAIRLERTIKDLRKKCVVCQKLLTKPAQQIMASLPADRVSRALPFEKTGLDNFGPIFVRDRAAEGQGPTKRWALLLTCMVTRAVHLEIVNSLSAEDFLQAFRRFVAERSVPSIIYSDNAKTFKKSAKELAGLEQICSKEAQEAVTQKFGCRWVFIPDRASHFGGVWERLVGLVKAPLRKALGLSLLSSWEIQTILKEIQCILNNRPLTAVSTDLDDPAPISPNKLLLGHDIQILPQVLSGGAKSLEEGDSAPKTLKGRWKCRQAITEQFWRIWHQNYLLTLSELSKWRHKMPSLQKGKLVLILDENRKRQEWPLAIIEELHEGRDGLTRAVTLRTAKGQLRRPIAKLVPLEADIIFPNQVHDDHPKVTRRSQRLMDQRKNNTTRVVSCLSFPFAEGPCPYPNLPTPASPAAWSASEVVFNIAKPTALKEPSMEPGTSRPDAEPEDPAKGSAAPDARA